MQSTRLPNGVRVVSETLADLPSVTAGIWVENGSRYETPEQAGISHFLEHLFFKGTERRTAAGIAEEMDAVGGVLNAFTGKEYTCYYAKVLREHLPMALDLLADIFTHSTFPADEVERERSVVIQEISQAEDTPDDYVHELFNAAFWPGHPLARPIAGTPDTVSALHREHPRRVAAHDFAKEMLEAIVGPKDVRVARAFENGRAPDAVVVRAAGPVEIRDRAVLLHDVDAGPPDAVPKFLLRIGLWPAVDALVDESEVARLREDLDELIGLRVDRRLIDRRSVFGTRVRERERLRVRREAAVGRKLGRRVSAGVVGRRLRRAARGERQRREEEETLQLH